MPSDKGWDWCPVHDTPKAACAHLHRRRVDWPDVGFMGALMLLVVVVAHVGGSGVGR